MKLLIQYRDEINDIDKKIIKLLEIRFKITKEIGIIKKKNGLTILNKKREEEIIKEKLKISSLNKVFLEKFFRLIFNESYKTQK